MSSKLLSIVLGLGLSLAAATPSAAADPSPAPAAKAKLKAKAPPATIDQRIRRIVSEQLGVEQTRVAGCASFVKDLGADSLDAVELVMALEDEFGIEIPDAEAEKLLTVCQAIAYVEKRVSQAAKARKGK